MNILDVFILGVIQGLTEFLPISSSGHLVIGQALMGLSSPGISLEIWLHLGTLLAVAVYFRGRVFSIVRSLIVVGETAAAADRTVFRALVVAMLPAVAVGLLLKARIETVFDSPTFAAVMLLVTAAVLMATRFARDKGRPVGIGRGLFIGLIQSAAILPGISRSGSTIAGGMFLGMSPSAAAEFSFLLAIPAIFGAFVLDAMKSGAALFSSGEIGLYLVGVAVSFLFGILSIHYLLKLIRRGRFFLFGFYCLVAGVISLILLG